MSTLIFALKFNKKKEKKCKKKNLRKKLLLRVKNGKHPFEACATGNVAS